MDFLTLIGIALGIGTLMGAQVLEGGRASALFDATALLIVMGGTLAGVMLQSSFSTLGRAVRILAWAMRPPHFSTAQAVEKIVQWSKLARKEGLLGLESISETDKDPFARKGLQLLVDGSEPQMMRSVLKMEVENREQAELAAVDLFKDMGRYSPALGIVAAALGLGEWLQHASDPAHVSGAASLAALGIVYGFGFANLFWIPLAGKLRSVVRAQSQYRRLIIEGIVSIAEGESPRRIETRLQGFLD